MLKAILTDYGYKYVAKDNYGVIDHANMVERKLFGFFGSYSKIGIFTIGGGIGIGAELNRRRRCITETRTTTEQAVPGTNCPDDFLMQIVRIPGPNEGSVADMRGWPYPVVLEGRISLGFVFEP